MCGICGIYSKEKNITSKLILSMTNSMVHRGPDDKGIFLDNVFAMGMRRLSIIDLKSGKQPISNENDSIHIVFNGEIYNYEELRTNLEKKGHKFKTYSDTETILHAYEEYGYDCLNYLNGMFAISIWDNEKKELFIARDRLGIKPLYYYFKNESLIFGSEIKSILKSGINRKLNLKAMHYYLGYEYVPAPESIFQDIKKLPQGHYLVFNHKKNKIKITKYWDCNFKAENKSEGYFVKKILLDLENSVKKRMISDVPLGAFLSGGVDSSLIVGLMSKNMSKPVKTFSMGFENESYNELPYARKVSELFNTNHTEKIVKADAVKLTNEIVKYFDEPFSDISSIPTFLVSKLTSNHVKVVLSGDGGDELFAGYHRYIASKISSYYKVPKFMKQLLAKNLKPTAQKKGFVNMLQRLNEGHLLSKKSRHMKWQYFSSKEIEDELYLSNFNKSLKGVDSFEPINKYYNQKFDEKLQFNKNKLDNEQISDINLYLPDDILVKVDRMSMANSLEARVPFLDHNFVELAMKIPINMRLNGFNTKYILKKAANTILPKEIVNRKKEGFSIPIKNWLKDDLRNYMEELLKKPFFVKDKLISQKGLNNMIEKHIENKHNYSHQLYSMMILELWHREYMLK
jgi:asparagine synthase (glutamine-hydrolysing)